MGGQRRGRESSGGRLRRRCRCLWGRNRPAEIRVDSPCRHSFGEQERELAGSTGGRRGNLTAGVPQSRPVPPETFLGAIVCAMAPVPLTIGEPAGNIYCLRRLLSIGIVRQSLVRCIGSRGCE